MKQNQNSIMIINKYATVALTIIHISYFVLSQHICQFPN
jgi:hypothetical protein